MRAARVTRVVATADLERWRAAEREFDWPDEPAERVREILKRVVSLARPARQRRRGGARRGDLGRGQRTGARAADRQARPDARCAAVGVRTGGLPGQRGPGARGGRRGRIPGAAGGSAAAPGGPRRCGRAAVRTRDRAGLDGLPGAQGGPQLPEGPPGRRHPFRGRRALPPDRDHAAALAAPRKT